MVLPTPLARPWRTQPTRARRTLNKAPLLFYSLDDNQQITLNPTGGVTIDNNTNNSNKTFFEFIINPSKLKITQLKLENWLLTKAGYERQFWQNELFKFEYSGSTGVFTPSVDGNIAAGPAALASDGFDITKTKAWGLFQEFNDFYLNVGPNVIAMHFWAFSSGFFYGSLNQFNYNISSDDPYRITYDFSFTGIPRTPIKVSSNKDSTSSTDGTQSVGVQGFPSNDSNRLGSS